MIPVCTAVIVNYRTPDLAKRCAESAIAHIDVPTELAIVDTSAGPGALVDPPPDVWVTYTDNVGYAAALNLAFAQSKSPFLIGLNADVEFPPDGIVPLLELFDEHTRLGVLGPRQVTPAGAIAHAGIERCGDHSGGRGYGEADAGQYAEDYLPVEQVSGSVLIIRRRAFDAVGGIPMTALYFEDALLCLRARRLGFEVGYSARRTFTHHVAASPEPADTSRAALAAMSHAMFSAELAQT